ncbi:protein max isoform X7 [Gorilla gorilla gorilla]|uniref:protein max isoform h n=1 Tax=Homo sapiens TaxID=9606 RepID=UPI00027CD729|nr:protein max isoform h [Homo sapiens]XP_003952560.1 protein max isoform X4 [Pan troglodytes]XP_008976018.1 protein max isoform X6 [Pan paniscus]|eukprot:NP_001257998.1 protein max isoform h [Homo sapiens]
MSDNDDIEVESDADKRAHHNALERKRRDHIKDSFHSLRDSVPSLQGEKGTKMKLTLPPVFPYEHLPFPTVFCHG